MERLTLSDEKRKEGYIVDSRAVQRNGMKFYLKLKEYEDLEEQGMLLRLPCKVGDTVYCIKARWKDAKGNTGTECYISKETAYSLEWIVSNIHKFGKTVFLTREEALNALSEIRSLTN